jgi:hypothetical protein
MAETDIQEEVQEQDTDVAGIAVAGSASVPYAARPELTL